MTTATGTTGAGPAPTDPVAQAALTCTGIAAGYGSGRPVVRRFDLSVQPGEIVALLGPNGSGKTTSMITVAGLIPSLDGTVTINGTALAAGNARAAVKAGLVLVPDDRSLFTGLTVSENLRLARRRGGTRVSEVLEFFPALQNRLKVSAGSLSGGEQQMLALGRALMQDPKVLLIDELSMGLAPVIVESLLPIVRRVATETHAAVVLVEQHVKLALGVADTAVVLAHGEIVLRGQAKDLLAHEEIIEQAYLGMSAAS